MRTIHLIGIDETNTFPKIFILAGKLWASQVFGCRSYILGRFL